MKPWDDQTPLKLFRRMSGAERLALGLHMTGQSVELLKQAIKILHPHPLHALRHSASHAIPPPAGRPKAGRWPLSESREPATVSPYGMARRHDGETQQVVGSWRNR